MLHIISSGQMMPRDLLFVKIRNHDWVIVAAFSVKQLIIF